MSRLRIFHAEFSARVEILTEWKTTLRASRFQKKPNKVIFLEYRDSDLSRLEFVT